MANQQSNPFKNVSRLQKPRVIQMGLGTKWTSAHLPPWPKEQSPVPKWSQSYPGQGPIGTWALMGSNWELGPNEPGPGALDSGYEQSCVDDPAQGVTNDIVLALVIAVPTCREQSGAVHKLEGL